MGRIISGENYYKFIYFYLNVFVTFFHNLSRLKIACKQCWGRPLSAKVYFFKTMQNVLLNHRCNLLPLHKGHEEICTVLKENVFVFENAIQAEWAARNLYLCS